MAAVSEEGAGRRQIPWEWILPLVLLVVAVLALWFLSRERLDPPDIDPVFDGAVDVPNGLSQEAEDYVTELRAALDSDVLFNSTICPETDPGGPCDFPIAFRASTVLVIGTPGDEARLREGGFAAVRRISVDDDIAVFAVSDQAGREFPLDQFEDLELGEGAQVVPDHIFSSAPIHRGHPADDPEITGPSATSAVPVGPEVRRIGVLDVEDSSVPVGQHGPFIVSIINGMGHQARLESVAGTYSDEDSSALYIDEDDIIAELEDLANDGDLDALSLSFGTFGGQGYQPAALAQALNDDGLPSLIVASAGNDETEQPVFPAAFDDVVAVGSVNGAGQRSCFSNFGDWVNDWRVGEEVSASALFPVPATGDEFDAAGSVSLSEQTATWSGTSFAAPIAAVEMAESPLNPPTAMAAPTAIGPETDPTWECGGSTS